MKRKFVKIIIAIIAIVLLTRLIFYVLVYIGTHSKMSVRRAFREIDISYLNYETLVNEQEWCPNGDGICLILLSIGDNSESNKSAC